MIWQSLVFAGLFIASLVTAVVSEALVVRRLTELNGGVPSPLVSKDGSRINVHNFRFAKFMFNLRDERDPRLAFLKKLNLWSTVAMFAFAIIGGILSSGG